MGKSKRPLPQGGAPDPKRRKVRDQGKPYVATHVYPFIEISFLTRGLCVA